MEFHNTCSHQKIWDNNALSKSHLNNCLRKLYRTKEFQKYSSPKREFIHNSLANTSSPIEEQSGHHHRSLLRLLVRSLPHRISKPRHIALHVKSEKPQQQKPHHTQIKMSHTKLWFSKFENLQIFSLTPTNTT